MGEYRGGRGLGLKKMGRKGERKRETMVRCRLSESIVNETSRKRYEEVNGIHFGSGFFFSF